jgi:GxxExxY protein
MSRACDTETCDVSNTKGVKNTKAHDHGLSVSNESDVSRISVDAIYKISKTLGPGLLETAYEECLVYELVKRGLNLERQKVIPIKYENIDIKSGFRADLIVNNSLLIELKSVEKLAPIHEAQILTYLRLSGIKTGLLVNFNTKLIKDGIRRFSL